MALRLRDAEPPTPVLPDLPAPSTAAAGSRRRPFRDNSRLIDGRVEDALVTENQAEVDHWLTKFDRVPLFRTTELEPNAEYYVRVRARARPRSTWSLLPWDRTGAWGHARFTFLP